MSELYKVCRSLQSSFAELVEQSSDAPRRRVSTVSEKDWQGKSERISCSSTNVGRRSLFGCLHIMKKGRERMNVSTQDGD